MSRIMSWIERSNERDDENLRAYSNRALIGRAIIGVVFGIKGIGLAMRGAQFWEYALAALLVAGGITFIYTSAQILIARRRGPAA
jgi:hypothetical protein